MRQKVEANWWERYGTLNLYGGKLLVLMEDDQDMVEIHYTDGMMIDVGYIEETQLYYITVVASNDMIGWKEPLLVVEVAEKENLTKEMQKVIDQFRAHIFS